MRVLGCSGFKLQLQTKLIGVMKDAGKNLIIYLTTQCGKGRHLRLGADREEKGDDSSLEIITASYTFNFSPSWRPTNLEQLNFPLSKSPPFHSLFNLTGKKKKKREKKNSGTDLERKVGSLAREAPKFADEFIARSEEERVRGVGKGWERSGWW